MFEVTDTVVRVPAAVLAARPAGIEIAGLLADLAGTGQRLGRFAAGARDGSGCRRRGRSGRPDRLLGAGQGSRGGAAAPRDGRTGSPADVRRLRRTRRRRPTHGVRGAASVVSAELRISPGNARARVELACELVEQLPAVLDALAAGRLDGYEARVIAEETRPLADRTGLRADVVDRLLAKADRQRPPPRCCRSAHQDHQPGDPRTLEQIRADVLADMGWSALQAGHLGCSNPSCGHVSMPLGTKRGRAAHVGVVVPLSTLLGIDDQPAHLQVSPTGRRRLRRAESCDADHTVPADDWRPDSRRQPGAAAPGPSCRQDPSRLAPQPARTRSVHLDLPHRAFL